ncbi:right-handed parallel beta-helix repeat-containing protein [Plantactinospora sp. GCM10030261]|uniref:right-handed parallel beta-helix repeat-containing protein n=1 Tax=Plantactinospora sp. GCM10030261 TaxID=3273420 RepID=UPI003617BE1F
MARSTAEAYDVRRVDAREHGLVGDGVTNDQPALAALVDRLGAAYAADGRPRAIYCPPGDYAIRDGGTVWRSGVSLLGAGIGVTRFLLANPADPSQPTPLAWFTTLQHGASRDNHIADCTFASFEIDGSGVQMARYNYLAKGLGLQYVLRGRFRDLYIHDTGATGLGCDFLQDTVIDAVVTERCGRLDNGQQMGGAGIGVGIGGWGTSERLTITACSTIGNGTNGIFVELQKNYWTPPRGIRILGCHSEGNRFGISDWGADGLIVTGCTILDNLEAGYDVSAKGTAGVAGRGGILADCVIDANAEDGVSIGNTPGPYLVRGNRISRNGRYGYRQHNLSGNVDQPARGIVIDGNDIWGNGLDGVHVDADLTDGAIVGNRLHGNGRRVEPAGTADGGTTRYERGSMTDCAANWRPDGQLGKRLTVGSQTATVVGNDRTTLTLAPVRPGVTTAWRGTAPADGTEYHLPDPPAWRAGITIAAATVGLTVRGNRIWDDGDPPTQTDGLWLTDAGSCVDAVVEDNDLAGNARAGLRLDNPPEGGRWHRNHGVAGRAD